MNITILLIVELTWLYHGQTEYYTVKLFNLKFTRIQQKYEVAAGLTYQVLAYNLYISVEVNSFTCIGLRYRNLTARLFLCKIWGFHGRDYEEWRRLESYVVWFL
jgi:hypothetical protein